MIEYPLFYADIRFFYSKERKFFFPFYQVFWSFIWFLQMSFLFSLHFLQLLIWVVR